MLPENGWPWMWEDSQMTDYAYAFDEASVHASCFGRAWFDPKNDLEKHDNAGPRAVFPTMLQGSDLREWRAMQKTFADAAKSRAAKNSS
jgi:hypothetical protein